MLGRVFLVHNLVTAHSSSLVLVMSHMTSKYMISIQINGDTSRLLDWPGQELDVRSQCSNLLARLVTINVSSAMATWTWGTGRINLMHSTALGPRCGIEGQSLFLRI